MTEVQIPLHIENPGNSERVIGWLIDQAERGVATPDQLKVLENIGMLPRPRNERMF